MHLNETIVINVILTKSVHVPFMWKLSSITKIRRECKSGTKLNSFRGKYLPVTFKIKYNTLDVNLNTSFIVCTDSELTQGCIF